MTSVHAIGNRITPAAATRRTAAPSANEPHNPSRAVVALAPLGREEPKFARRPQADFLAHLIATAERAPQTRDKRRAEPDYVIAAYQAARDAAQPVRPSEFDRLI